MKSKRDDRERGSYAVGAVSRITGLSPHVLRAWERRYGAIHPERTPGGSRRYASADVQRLKLLRAAVESGHPISELAPLSDAELQRRASEAARSATATPVDEILGAAYRLDARALERLLGTQFAALGPRLFAYEIALPLLQEIGRRWERGEMSVASEHMTSAVMRSMLGIALRGTEWATSAPAILFTTPPGELHEFGILVGALVTLGVGGNAVYLGPGLPAQEVVQAASVLGASVVVVGFAMTDDQTRISYLRALREDLPEDVEIWIGGDGDEGPARPAGVERLADFDELERRVLPLSSRPPQPAAR